MKLKTIGIEDVARILQSAEDNSLKKIANLKSIKIHPETYRMIKKIQKSNNISSVYMTIDLLIISTALAQASDNQPEQKKMIDRITKE